MISKEQILEKLQAQTTIDESTGCWLWQGGQNSDGYGTMHIDTSIVVVSRASCYIHHNLEFDSELLALHKCKSKNCWNPDHLYVGTQSDNMQDAFREGTRVGARRYNTHCKFGHPLDGIASRGTRYCKTCNRFKSKMNRETRKIIRGLK